MAGSPPNLHTMDSRSACIQGVLKVKVKIKGHVIRALSWILGMSYSVIDGLVFLSVFGHKKAKHACGHVASVRFTIKLIVDACDATPFDRKRCDGDAAQRLLIKCLKGEIYFQVIA